MAAIAQRRLAAGVAILSLVLAACGGSQASSSPSSAVPASQPPPASESAIAGKFGTASLFLLDGPTVKVMADAAQEFSGGSQGTVEVTAIAGDSYQQKIRTIMGSGQRPDMFYNWSGATISDYVDAGLLLNLDEMISAHPEIAAGFQPSILDAGKIGGKQYAIPMNGTGPVLIFYNKKIFDEAGLQPPETWDDVETLIDEFKGRDITPFALAGSQAWCDLEWMEYLIDRLGGPDLFAGVAAGDWSKWDDPAVLEAARMVKTLVDAGAFGTNYSSVAYGAGGSTSLMLEGKAAMTLQGTWEYPVAQQVDEDFVAKYLGVVPFPAIPGGEGDPQNLVGNPANYVSVTAEAQATDTIAAFLAQLSSDAYAQALMQNSEVPTTKNASEFVDFAPSPDFAKLQIDLVSNAPSFQLSWDLAIKPEQATPLLQNIQDLFNGALSPEEFVAAVQSIGS